MTRTTVLVGFLIFSGLIAAAIGAAITFQPVAFAASNGIELAADPSHLSEVRAPGGALLAFGLWMLAGAAVRELRFSASLAAAAVYLPYGLARAVGLALDGVPANGLLLAMGVELAIGALGLVAAAEARRQRPPASESVAKRPPQAIAA